MPDTAFVEFKFPYDLERDAFQHELDRWGRERWADNFTAHVIMIVPEATPIVREVPANAP